MEELSALTHVRPCGGYLSEVKRYISNYSIYLYQQKMIPDEQLVAKDRLNELYQDLMKAEGHHQQRAKHSKLMQQLFQCILSNIADGGQVVSSIWKASVTTIVKLLSYQEVIAILTYDSPEDTSLAQLDPNILVQILLEAKIDPVDHNEEEQKLILKQKVLLKIAETFALSELALETTFRYILKVTKEKTLKDLEGDFSPQFGDACKKNVTKLFQQTMTQNKQSRQPLLKIVISKVMKQIRVLIPVIEAKKGTASTLKIKEYICFLIKTIEDSIKKVPQEEFGDFLLPLKSEIFELICTGAEIEDIMVRNQSQQLFSFFLTQILDLNLPLREELEFLFVKVVLKPALTHVKRINASTKDIKKSVTSTNSGSLAGDIDNHSESEGEDFIKVQVERTVHDDILLEMSMNYILETFLQLKPQQLGQLFLLYDCQPFSESIITKSLSMLVRFAQSKPQTHWYRLCETLVSIFQGFQEFQPAQQQAGPQPIAFMREQKSQAKRQAKELNAKFKTFLQKLDDMYSYADPQTPAEVASKILTYSRDVQISKVIEVIGGKDDRAKRIMEAYLDKMNFKDGCVEYSMRRFLTTFRLAGVDSQVVSRIIERFSFKFFDEDPLKTFKTKEEAHDFIFLLIVLQTNQHNPSIKMRIDVKQFTDQAYANMPHSKDIIPKEFFEKIYNSVTNNAFFTPISRSLIEDNYNKAIPIDIQIRLTKSEERQEGISEREFINTADLTAKQLFHYNNSFNVPASLLALANKHLVTFLTTRFIKQLVTSQAQEATQAFPLAESLVSLNKSFNSLDLVDRLFSVMYTKLPSEVATGRLEVLLWDNFDFLKRSLVLLPRIAGAKIIREDVKQDLKEGLIAVRRMVGAKYAEKRRVLRIKDKEGNSGAPHQPPAKSPSFLDIVYNYFTDANEQEDEREKARREEQEELKTLTEIRKRLLMEGQETDYQESIEERFDDKISAQWAKEKQRLHELISVICTQIRENYNQEDGTLCLSFLDHIVRKAGHTPETFEKLWVEIQLLVNTALKATKSPAEANSPASVSERKSSGVEYEVISNECSQDSLDYSQLLDVTTDVQQRETNPLKLKHFETLNRHLILQLHLYLSTQVLRVKPDSQQVIKEIQRLIANLIEEKSEYQNVEEVFMYEQINRVFAGQEGVDRVRRYPKASKIIRLMLILVLKGQSKRVGAQQLSESQTDEMDRDQQVKLLSAQLELFKTVTSVVSELAPQLPYDLISLSLDVFSKLPGYPSARTPEVQHVIETAICILDNITLALQNHALLDPELRVELWFRTLQTLQQQVLFTPYVHQFMGLTLQGFNLLKNSVLSHPFELKHASSYSTIRKLFAEILFAQSFDSLQEVNGQIVANSAEEYKVSSEKPTGLTTHLAEEDSEEELTATDCKYRLEQMSMIAVNNISDIFIYYIATVYQDSGPSQTTNEQQFQLFAFLWLTLLKQLLNFAEQGHSKGLNGLVICAHDNIKRVVEFLIQQKILVGGEPGDTEMAKIWNKSWESIGAFFHEMKAQVVGETSQVVNTTETVKIDPVATTMGGISSV